MDVEDSFPRGGNLVLKREFHDNDQLFNLAKPHKTKKPKKSKERDHRPLSDKDFQAGLNLKGTLNYSKIQPGMVILGCVRRVLNLALEVELPGLCFVIVPVTNISAALNKYLSQQLENNKFETTTLNDIFFIGEFLPVKIMDISSDQEETLLEGSINPTDIYSEHNFNSFKKNMLVWATVTSKSDHGYEMSLGLESCRAFLPFSNVNPGVDLAIGKPVWCVIHKFNATGSSSIVRLSAKSDHIKTTQFDIENLDMVIPGSKVEVLIDKISTHGIYAKLSDNFVAYIDENYLAKPLNKVTDYQNRNVLNAFVLYVEPTTKIVYVSLRRPELQEQSEHSIAKGDVVKAMVHSKGTNGVFFVLPDAQKGFSTNKRLIATVNKQSNVDLMAAVDAKYAVGSTYRCRILDYNHISKTYICSPELNIVKEKTFVSTDLQPGQLVQVKIVSIKEEGIVVSSGRVKGFVPNLHISNMEYTSSVKKKFKEYQLVDARVLVVEDEKVLFTMKPKLIENDQCLNRIEDAQLSSKYPGVVVKISSFGALVVFYSNVKGWLEIKRMGKHVSDTDNYFFVGQVVNVYVSKVEESKLYLSLFPPRGNSVPPTIGGRYCGVVQAINADGVKIQIDNSDFKGFIPNAHISDNLSLCESVKKILTVGTKLTNLVFIGKSKTMIYSRREGIFFANKKLPSLNDLKIGDIIRCSYERSFTKNIRVKPLINNFTKSVSISKKYVDDEMTSLVEHQLLLAKVLKVDSDKEEIVLSVKLKDVYDYTVESTLRFYSIYFTEMAFLYQSGKKLKWPICNLSSGDQVQGIVEKVGNQGGCIISLTNQNVKGIAAPSLCPADVKVGDVVTGTVIAHDYEKQYVDVCLKKSICNKLNSIQEDNLNEAVVSSTVKKLLVKDEYIICLSRHKNDTNRLINVPRRLHLNDVSGCDSYHDNKNLKICICGKIKSFWLGMSKTLFVRLDKLSNKHKKVLSKKRKLNTKDDNKDCKSSKLDTSVTEMEDDVLECDSGISEDNNVNVVEPETAPCLPTLTQNTTVKRSIVLPGVSSYFVTQNMDSIAAESSDEDYDGPIEKKKKLSPAERAILLRQEEERISNMEKELADPTTTPESAEHFDRLLISKPDSAELWAKYIAFHIAGTEIDKARAVAKRALETINMTLVDEKFKIWIILLNVENLFGMKENFDNCLQDALKYNDQLKVYLKAIEMLSKSSKFNEMEELISKVKGKYKQDMSMWLEVAKVYYQIGKLREARNCKEKALTSITDKKSQIAIIVRLAILEFQYGEIDEGSTVFETILRTDPKKVNIWVTYVDQLTKRNCIDEARQVLERAVSQKLPLKSAKSLFMKFRKFEEVHGNVETVEVVKQRAQDYIDKFHKY